MATMASVVAVRRDASPPRKVASAAGNGDGGWFSASCLCHVRVAQVVHRTSVHGHAESAGRFGDPPGFRRLRPTVTSSTHLRVWKAPTVASAVVVAKIRFGGLVAVRYWIVRFRFGGSKRSSGRVSQMLRQLARNTRLDTALRFSVRSSKSDSGQTPT
jgi:hypothetical protein